jgi:predicted ATP-dependent endonuclease of OLD family
MLDAIRIRNLRSFPNNEESPFIHIKPLTILVGTNSSGKSTFLRTFPLLRQSDESKTTGPILWYGSYVDFGAFEEAKNNKLESDLIFFDFILKVSLNNLIMRRDFFQNSQVKFKKSSITDLQIELGVGKENEYTIAKIVKIKLDDLSFEIKLEPKKKCSLYLNNKKEIGNESLRFRSLNFFIPVLGADNKFETTFNGEKIQHITFETEFLENFAVEKYIPKLKEYFHHKSSDENIVKKLRMIGLVSKKDLISYLESFFKDNKTFIENIKKKPDEIANLAYKTLILMHFNDLLHGINIALSNLFKNVRYIAPLRATAERYYRHQDLQVDEIDHTGSNLAILLKSLSEKDRRKFSEWTKSQLGFTVRVDVKGLHYALKISTTDSDNEYNINDMGFGFSQILPIITSIWLETQIRINRRRSQPKIFTIEQPELHLHPEYQYRLAKLFARIVNIGIKDRLNIQIVFETHSKTMIDALGELIESNELNKEDVNIVLFNKDQNQTSTEVRFSEFDEEGYLTKWPIGFLSGR